MPPTPTTPTSARCCATVAGLPDQTAATYPHAYLPARYGAGQRMDAWSGLARAGGAHGRRAGIDVGARPGAPARQRLGRIVRRDTQLPRAGPRGPRPRGVPVAFRADVLPRAPRRDG